MDSLFLLTFYCIVTEYVRKIRKKFSLEPHFLFAIEIKHYNRCISKGTGKRDISSNDLRISSFDERERLKIYGYSKDDFWQKIWPIFSTFMKYLVVLTSMDKIIDQTKMPTKTVLLKINIISQMQQFYGIYINDVYLIQSLCTLFAYPLFPTFSKQTIWIWSLL